MINASIDTADNAKPHADGNGMGGPTEVISQIKDDDLDKKTAFRFPLLDEKIQNVKDWKNQIYKKHGCRFGHQNAP
mgnify:CR=1 FL=1